MKRFTEKYEEMQVGFGILRGSKKNLKISIVPYQIKAENNLTMGLFDVESWKTFLFLKQ